MLAIIILHDQGIPSGASTYPHKSVLGLKLLLGTFIIVNEGESSASSTTKHSTEAKGDDAGLVGLIDAGELFRELGL
jgi:hypothetical protein